MNCCFEKASGQSNIFPQNFCNVKYTWEGKRPYYSSQLDMQAYLDQHLKQAEKIEESN